MNDSYSTKEEADKYFKDTQEYYRLIDTTMEYDLVYQDSPTDVPKPVYALRKIEPENFAMIARHIIMDHLKGCVQIYIDGIGGRRWINIEEHKVSKKETVKIKEIKETIDQLHDTINSIFSLTPEEFIQKNNVYEILHSHIEKCKSLHIPIRFSYERERRDRFINAAKVLISKWHRKKKELEKSTPTMKCPSCTEKLQSVGFRIGTKYTSWACSNCSKNWEIREF